MTIDARYAQRLAYPLIVLEEEEMKKVVIASFVIYAVFQLGVANADFKVVEDPTPGQQIYWTMQNDKSSPCAWYEVWEVLAIQKW